MKKCENNSLCGWRGNGHYECYCHSLPTDKISRIKLIFEKFDRIDFSSGRFDDVRDKILTITLNDIRKIIEEKN